LSSHAREHLILTLCIGADVRCISITCLMLGRRDVVFISQGVCGRAVQQGRQGRERKSGSHWGRSKGESRFVGVQGYADLKSSRRKTGNAADRDKVHYRKLHQSILRLPNHPPLFRHGGRFTSRSMIQARHRVQDSVHHPGQAGDGEDCAPTSRGRDFLHPTNGYRRKPLRSTNLSGSGSV